MPINILIADDHPLIAQGIKNTFENNSEFHIAAILENGKQVIDFLKTNKVDIALLDIDMPIMDGIKCAKEIIRNHQNTKVAMLSMHQETSIIKELINIGVKGYMLKTVPSNELLQAVKTIYKGKEFFSSDVTKALLFNQSTKTSNDHVEKSSLLEQLTAREKEIITYVANGFTNNQIGEKLFISPRTVDTHRTNIMKKLDIHNVASLIRFAFLNGLSS